MGYSLASAKKVLFLLKIYIKNGGWRAKKLAKNDPSRFVKPSLFDS